jgi:hypothetical protein
MESFILQLIRPAADHLFRPILFKLIAKETREKKLVLMSPRAIFST